MTIAAVAVALCGAAPAADQQAPTAADLAARIQARQQTVRDFTTDFTLTTKGPLLPREPEEQGTLVIKKPGRLRQTTKTGDRNVFVADGKNLYLYFRRDGYVEITPLPEGDDFSTLFLTGRGDLVRDFEARLAPTSPPDEWHLILTPKQTQPGFRSLTLQVDRKSLRLRGLVVEDRQATLSTYRFSNLRENTGVSDREFEFRIPDGVAIRRP